MGTFSSCSWILPNSSSSCEPCTRKWSIDDGFLGKSKYILFNSPWNIFNCTFLNGTFFIFWTVSHKVRQFIHSERVCREKNKQIRNTFCPYLLCTHRPESSLNFNLCLKSQMKTIVKLYSFGLQKIDDFLFFSKDCFQCSCWKKLWKKITRCVAKVIKFLEAKNYFYLRIGF